MELLNNLSWQLVSLIASIIIGILGVIFTFLTIKRKKISYEILTSIKIISIKNDMGDSEKLKISFDNRIVENIWLYEIEFSNSGNTPILLDDFIVPINLDFTGKGRVLNCNVIKTKPNDFQPNITTEEFNISINPQLINRNDKFTIRILVDRGIDDFPTVQGRIIGTEIRKKKYSLKKVFDFILPFIAAYLGFFATILIYPKNQKLFVIIWITAVGIIIFLIFEFIKSLLKKQEKSKKNSKKR